MYKRFLAMAVVAVMLQSTVYAQQFYATNNLNATLGGTGDSLVQFDFSNGNFETIGEIGGGGIQGTFGGLDWIDDTSTGTLVGTVSEGGVTVGEFYLINPANADAVFIGNAVTDMSDLALNRADNRMYGIDSSDGLYRDDDGDSIPENLLGTFGGIGGTNVGLAFDDSGNLFLLDLDSNAIFTVAEADVQAGNLDAITTVAVIPFNVNFEQGLYFGGGTGYHAAINPDTFQAENYTFNADGNYTLASIFPEDAASGFPSVQAGDLALIPTIISGFFPPVSFNTFRGVLTGVGLADVQNSDDSRLTHRSGFTINQTESPVWLEFDGQLTPTISSLNLQLESRANTPGLSYQAELFNWNTGLFEVVGNSVETFNNDTVSVFSGSVAAHVDPSGAVRARVGWQRTGFTILFPWIVEIDHVCWNVN